MKLSANQAAKEIGKSVPTITRAIKSGRLSATERQGGGYEIDPSELFRVWPRVTDKDNVQENALSDTRLHDTRVLEAKLEAQAVLLEQVKAQLADAMQQRDSWQRQAETMLVGHQTGMAKDAHHPSLWERIFGKR